MEEIVKNEMDPGVKQNVLKIIKNKLLGKAMNKIQFEMSRIVEEIIMKMRKKEMQKVCENLKVLV